MKFNTGRVCPRSSKPGTVGPTPTRTVGLPHPAGKVWHPPWLGYLSARPFRDGVQKLDDVRQGESSFSKPAAVVEAHHSE